MKVSKNRMRKVLYELHHGAAPQQVTGVVPIENDYDKVRNLLDGHPEMVEQALNMVMSVAGATCPISTRQAIIDHLQDELQPQAPSVVPVGTVMAEARLKSRLRRRIMLETSHLRGQSLPFAEERANITNITAILDMISSDIVDKLMAMGPTDTLELVKTFGGEWSKDEIFQAVDLLVDEGEVYFDDDGTLFLIPEHSAELERSGAY